MEDDLNGLETTLIQMALAIPTLGALGIALTGLNRNVREAVTLVTAGALFSAFGRDMPYYVGGAILVVATLAALRIAASR